MKFVNDCQASRNLLEHLVSRLNVYRSSFSRTDISERGSCVLCGEFMFMHSCIKLSSSSVNVAFVAVPTFDFVGTFPLLSFLSFSFWFQMILLTFLICLWVTLIPCGSNSLVVISDTFLI